MAGMPRKTWQHGTATGYRHHWCRCDDCTAANSAACKEDAPRLRLLAANRKLVAAMETTAAEIDRAGHPHLGVIPTVAQLAQLH